MRSRRDRVARRIGAAAGASAAVAALMALPGGRADARVIVVSEPGQLAAAERAVTAAGGSVHLSLPSIDGFSATIARAELPAVGSDPAVLGVAPDAPVQLDSSSYDPTTDSHSLYSLENETGVRSVWGRATGAGVGVAVIDSGVTPVAGLSDPGQVLAGPDFTAEASNPATAGLDGFGHGTFMAGIIAGHDGTAPVSAADGQDFLGVAPDAKIVSVKVADHLGNTSASQIIAGIEWTIGHAHDPGINVRVLNLSFGADPYGSYQVDPLAFAAEQAWRAGITVVVSAGNSGSTSAHLSAPALDPTLLAVGSEDPSADGPADGTVSSFSSLGDGIRNPDVVAPGEHVQSLTDPGSYVATHYASTGAITPRFFRGSGTSQAAAFTSGVAALLAQSHPAWTPDQIKSALVATAVPLAGATPQAAGAGALRAAAADDVESPAPLAARDPAYSPVCISHIPLDGTTRPNGDLTLTARLAAIAARCGGQVAAQGGSWSGSSWSGSSWSGSSWSDATWLTSRWK